MKAHTEVNGRTIHYAITGEGDPILVLGVSAEPVDFGLLADWFELLTPEWPADQTGGRLVDHTDHTDRADGVEHTDRTDHTDLGALIERLDLWPVRLLAWGEASRTALRLTMERPELVRRLAVVGPLPACDGLPCRTRLAALATMTTPLLILQGDDEALDVAHSAALTRTVPDGRLAVLPGPSHRLPAARAELAGLILLEFFEER